MEWSKKEYVTTVDDDEGIAVPESQFGLRDEHYEVLQQHVNPLLML